MPDRPRRHPPRTPADHRREGAVARGRTRAVVLSYEASTYLNSREPERAAATASEALTLAHQLEAPRCIRLIKNLSPDFTPYTAADGVPVLLAQLRAVSY
ncbi:hypothetical protein [Streptomyces sp. 3213.3]|uniref:hypothetical protein n=1 Tax=Streptomyces sp. 3213.3 TaxID=1855348 RepID=UPI0010426521|nr:hypothetical protein [Streptomyces sp. 3213.3]